MDFIGPYLIVATIIGSCAYAMDDKPSLPRAIAAGLAWPVWLILLLLAML